jgi:hypothetical protein
VFLSKSYRNHGQPISIWTWSKAIARCSLGRKCAKFSGSVCELLVLVRVGVSTAQKFSVRKRVRGSSGQMVRWNAGTEHVKIQRKTSATLSQKA